VNLLAVLPLAFVMVAGPQIISAFFFATSEDWKRLSVAYVAGAALSITAIATIAFFFIDGVGSDDDSGLNAVDYVTLALLVVAAIYVYRGRNDTEPPKWMGKLQEATPKATFILGFLLLGFFPSDIITSITVGAHLANAGDPWWHVLVFVLLTLLLLALPATLVWMMGERAQTFLPKIREWIDTKSWIVSEFVIAFFIVMILAG
jgi:Sap, sulfolipid-1-addressing protein